MFTESFPGAHMFSKTFMILSGNEKLSCQRSILDSWVLNMLGRNSWHVRDKLVSIIGSFFLLTCTYPNKLLQGDFMICNSSFFDLEMFKAVWKSVISAIAHAFISFEEDYIIQRAISGFRQCATLAGQFHLPDVFDFVVVSLSQVTSLLSESLPARVPNYPVIDVESQSITVSSLSVKFGTNFKGQLAAVVLFNIVNGNGNAIREGWMQVRMPLSS